MPGDSPIQDTQHQVKPPKHCFVHCTASKQQMELEICVHDTTLHPSEEKEMERNEMRFSRHLHTKHQRWCFCGSVTQKKRDSEYVSHLCDTQRSGLLAGLCRRFSSQAPAWHVRHERAGFLLVRPFYLFIFYLNPLSPSLFLHIISHPFWFSPLSTFPFIPGYPLTSPSLHLASHLPLSVSSLQDPSPTPPVSLSSPLLG